MKYLRLFNNYSEYEANKSNLEYPNVTIINKGDGINFDVILRDEAPIEFVDLGLSVKWSPFNLGATSPEEFGLYYAWGETDGYSEITTEKKFNWSDYKFSKETTGNTFKGVTKYNNDSANGDVDNLNSLLPEDDAAYNFDNTWRLPTKEEAQELFDNTTSVWTTVNGVSGKLFTSKINGNQIFFPSCGYLVNGNLSSVGTSSHYYTSDLSNTKSAYFMSITNGSHNISNSFRCYGRNIRPVQ